MGTDLLAGLGWGLGVALFIIFFWDVTFDTTKQKVIYFGSIVIISGIGGLLGGFHSQDAVIFGALGAGGLVAYILDRGNVKE